MSNEERMREFYNQLSMRRHHHHHQMMQMQMQQQMMHMHWMQQQHFHRQQQFHFHMHQQFQMQQMRQMQQMQMRPFVENDEFSGERWRENGEGSSRRVALPVPDVNVTNLDRLMKSVTPFVSVEYLSAEFNGRKSNTPFFRLGALWQSFNQWSAFGAGVPLQLNGGKDLTDQYYVPYLSGMQLYADPSKDSSQPKLPTEETDVKSCRLNGRPSTPEAAIDNNLRSPVFQYLERELPHNRRPLSDTISLLVSQHPELSKYRSCDLLPTSWICVAWYPIYRIPLGPTMKDLQACFLTFHCLSTHPQGNHFPPAFHAANTRRIHGSVDPSAKISLPPFGLATYKLKGSIVGPCGSHEREQENSLMNAAKKWLNDLEVQLPDFKFFSSHSSNQR